MEKEIMSVELDRGSEEIIRGLEERDAEIMEAFWAVLDVFESTLRTYKRTMGRFLDWIHEQGLSLEDVGAAHLLAYKRHLGESLKPSTVNTYLIPVKRFYRFISARSGRPNITSELKAGRKKAEGHAKDALTEEQAQAILDYLKSRLSEGIGAVRDYAIFSLLLTCGLRTIEAARANVEDVTEIDGIPVLWIQGKGHTEKDCFTPLSPFTLRAIRSYLESRGNVSPSSPLFVSHSNNNRGGRLTERSISATAKEAMRANGIDSPRLTAHSLRHTAITQALLKGATLQEAQELARHKDPKTTEIYAHNLDRLRNRAARFAADYH